MNSSLKSVLVLNLVFIVFSLTPLYKIYSEFIFKLSSPLLVRASSLNSGLVDFFGFVKNLPESFEAARELKVERVQEAAITAQRDILKSENDILRSQLKVAAQKKLGNLLMAKVAGEASADTLILNVGKNDGAAEGDLVLEGQTILGRLIKVETLRSQLLLTVSPQSSFEAVDLSSGARGLVAGNFGSGLKLSKVLPSQELNAGDILTDSSSGLVLGRVEKTAAEGTNIFKEAEVSVLYDPAALSSVFVLLQ